MLHRSLLSLLLGSLTVIAATALPAPTAHACSPPFPGLTGSIPRDGDTYPGNAALFFEGFDLSLDNVTATIDDQPATLVQAADIVVPGNLIAKLAPVPTAGQRVKITGKLCSEPTCEEVSISYTAGEADTVAPPATTVESFNVYDHADYKAQGGECASDVDVSYWVHLTSPALAAGESPRLYTIEGYRDSKLGEAVVSASGFVREQSHVSAFALLASQLGGAEPAEALCFRVVTQDAAGNHAEASEVVCKPCHYKADETPHDTPPSEPQWTAADVYPGGPCDTSGGEGDSGCSVHGPSRSSPAPAMMGLALAFAVLARASRRRARR
ncbi:MAG: hypothetical protein QM820_57570 [Minicystis sp.]